MTGIHSSAGAFARTVGAVLLVIAAGCQPPREAATVARDTAAANDTLDTTGSAYVRRAEGAADTAAFADANGSANSGAPASSDSANVSRTSASGATASASAQRPADTTARATPPATPSGPASSAAPSPDVSVPEGRSKRDSLGLARAVRTGLSIESWPVSPSASQPGAVLPHQRIVAYYGNPLSRRMGALGEFPVDEMLERLDREVQAWREADPDTPVKPALHLVAVVAQADAGRDGKYRARMADTLVERVYEWAQRADALLFLDIQVGLASITDELPRLEKFLSKPDVHLGIDPEFSMKTGARPGTRIGTFDAADINHTSRFLADIAERYNLPPKILVVHRFTQSMVTNSSDIQLNPRVQVVMHMDGWGPPWLKYDSYREFVLREPVEFTGFKIFYGNDTRTGTKVLTAGELVQLVPAPFYIQYQ